MESKRVRKLVIMSTVIKDKLTEENSKKCEKSILPFFMHRNFGATRNLKRKKSNQ
jgi:hypothetical protein